MPRIELRTKILAPIARCFDLSRSIDLHILSTKQTNEKAVAGITSGLIDINESVTWEAKHFGIVQRMTSKISELKSPKYFISIMVKGAFKSFLHVHEFKEVGGHTVMIDKLEFRSPLGILGKIVDRLVLRRYMTNLILKRNETIKKCAESDQWNLFL